MKTLRIRVEVEPAFVDGLEPECVDVLRVGVLVSPCYHGVRIDGPCMLPIVSHSPAQAVTALHDLADMSERVAGVSHLWPAELAVYALWLRDVAAFYRLVAEQLVLRRARLWPEIAANESSDHMV
jgi:hypothetical protein